MPQFKISSVIALVLFLSSAALADPADCVNFAGKYAAVATGKPLVDPSVLVITSGDKDALNLIYGQAGETRYRNESYVADGAQHHGDVLWTSTFYTVSCAPGVMTIVKDFRPSLNEVYTSQYTLVNGVLSESIIYSENGYQQLRGTYQRQ